MKVYVYYEESSRALLNECDYYTELHVFSTLQKALEHMSDMTAKNCENGNWVSADKHETGRDGEVYHWMFWAEDVKNHEDPYDCDIYFIQTIKEMEVL